ncbi:MAG: hypothetical protein K0V04_02635 [Deltaproteobacteria bacterium]|nr:hypothetical protein [Deltaproteobacteria bacterium]
MPALQLLSRTFSSRTLIGLGAAALLLSVGCRKGDVGAPCNHGQVEPPESKLVTFPALACNDLLCVYADEAEALDIDCTVGDNVACNVDPAENKFECVATSTESNTGVCRLRVDYVLERSMCSKKCSNDADCQDGGITSQVVADDTSCKGGFQCARIQTLGKFCCEKLCVCEDDLGVTSDIDVKCSSGTQEGCCTGEGIVPSDACNKP